MILLISDILPSDIALSEIPQFEGAKFGCLLVCSDLLLEYDKPSSLILILKDSSIHEASSEEAVLPLHCRCLVVVQESVRW